MTEKSLEEFVDASLLYDWLESEGRIASQTFLINYTDEEMVDFIRFIVKEWIKYRRENNE